MPENQTAWESDKELKKHSSRLVGGATMGSQAEKTCGKAADHMSEAGLAEWETKDSKPLAVKYCGGCDGGRNSQSHRRVHWKVGLKWSHQVALFPL